MTTAIAREPTWSAPQDDAAGDGGRALSFARHLGLEHMAFHGVQGRGVLVDLRHHIGDEWRRVNLVPWSAR